MNSARNGLNGRAPRVPDPRRRRVSERGFLRWGALSGAVVILALALVGTSRVVQATTIGSCSATQTTDCVFAGFEIDGNVTADSSSGLDWQSSPKVFGSTPYTAFYDLSGSTSDNIMGQGSKESDQTTWSCVNHKADAKDDLGANFLATDYSGSQFAAQGSKQWAGAIWFETVNSKQFLFGSFQRLSANGDAHVDFEFNRAKQTFTCGGDTLPVRESGDVLVTFDGNGPLSVAAFTWTCVTTGAPAGDPNRCNPAFSGSFNQDTNLTAGVTFAGQTNTTAAGQSDPNLAAGVFGEAGLDLTDTIGNFSCGEFGNAFMKDRTASASSIASGSAEVKDYVSPLPFNPGLCPASSISKAQADETTQLAGAADETESPTTAEPTLTYNQKCSSADSAAHRCASGALATPMSTNPGDEVVYQLTYANTGPGAAPNPVVQDTIPTGTTYVASSQSCPSGATCIAASSTTYNSTTPCSSTPATSGQTVTNLVWCLPSEAGNSTQNLYYEVDVASSATNPGTTTIENFATVTDTQITSDKGGTSNYVAANVTYAPSSSIVKAQADVQSVSQQCNTATIGSTSSTTSCIQVPGASTSVSSATFTSSAITAGPGDTVAYKLTYTNSGTSNATGVTVSDSIPTHSTYVASSCSNSCTTTTVSGVVTKLTWALGTVAPGSGNAVSVTFEVKLDSVFPAFNGTGTVPATNKVLNQGSVTTTQEQTAINSNQVEADVSAAGSPGLVKTAGAPFTGGVCPTGKTCVTWTISYFNTGSGSLSGQTISDTIPTGVTYVANSCAGGTAQCTESGGVVTWTVNVAGGTSATSPAGTVSFTVDY